MILRIPPEGTLFLHLALQASVADSAGDTHRPLDHFGQQQAEALGRRFEKELFDFGAVTSALRSIESGQKLRKCHARHYQIHNLRNSYPPPNQDSKIWRMIKEIQSDSFAEYAKDPDFNHLVDFCEASAGELCDLLSGRGDGAIGSVIGHTPIITGIGVVLATALEYRESAERIARIELGLGDTLKMWWYSGHFDYEVIRLK